MYVPNVRQDPGGTVATTPALNRLSSMNVPFVLSKSVTNSFPSFFWMRACTPDTVNPESNANMNQ